MKAIVAILILLSCAGSWKGNAQDRQFVESELKRLNNTNENLLEAQAAMQRRIDGLVERCRALEQQIEKANENSISRADLKKMIDQVAEEFDQKRKEDRKYVLDALEEIRKLAKTNPSEAQKTPAPADEKEPEFTGKWHPYKVKDGQVLGAIIESYNEAYKAENKGTITLKEVLRANPGLKPEKLRVGQTIRIPEPSKP